MGSGGAIAPPKVLICRKSEQNRWRFGQKWRPMLFDLKNGTQHFQKITWRPILGFHTKRRSSWSLICVDKFFRKPRKLFEQVWVNSGKNPSHPQKFASPKPMYIYRFSNQIWMVFRHKRNRKPFWVVKLWFTINNLEICVSVIFCHVVYWGCLVLGSSNSLQSCVCPSILDNNPP